LAEAVGAGRRRKAHGRDRGRQRARRGAPKDKPRS
jgi:hypothetical protein